jgi:hypothetical protein
MGTFIFIPGAVLRKDGFFSMNRKNIVRIGSLSGKPQKE